MKTLFAAFQQTAAHPRLAGRAFPSAVLLIFGKACRILGQGPREYGSRKAHALEGTAFLFGAQQVRFSTNSRLYRSCSRRDLVVLSFSFPARGGWINVDHDFGLSSPVSSSGIGHGRLASGAEPGLRDRIFLLKPVPLAVPQIAATMNWRPGAAWSAHMTPSQAATIDAQTVEEYCFNRLSQNDSARVEEHIAACLTCARALEHRKEFIACIKGALKLLEET